MSDEYEHIDVSEWLGNFDMSSTLACNGDVLIERHPSDIPGKLGKIRSAIRVPTTLLYWFRHCKIISNSHLWEAETFSLWREVFSSNFGNRKSSTSAKGGESIGGLNEYAYILVLQRLGRENQILIENLLDTPANEFTKRRCEGRDEEFVKALDRLVWLVDEVREQVRDIPAHGDGWAALKRGMGLDKKPIAK